MPAAETKLRKPISLYLLAAGYLGAMLLHILHIYLRQRHIYPHDVVLLVLYPIAAYGIYRVRRWGWYLVVSHILFLLISNSVLAIQLRTLNDILMIQLNLLLLFFLWFFLRHSVRSPFHNPALRWWERQHKRYGASFKVMLRKAAGGVINTQGINLSSGGCFVELGEGQELSVKDRLDIELSYEDFEPYRAKGRVTWVSSGGEVNPRGAGIAFTRADRPNRMLLSAILRLVEARWMKAAQHTSAFPDTSAASS